MDSKKAQQNIAYPYITWDILTEPNLRKIIYSDNLQEIDSV